jgi:hypothetical protein
MINGSRVDFWACVNFSSGVHWDFPFDFCDQLISMCSSKERNGMISLIKWLLLIAWCADPIVNPNNWLCGCFWWKLVHVLLNMERFLFLFLVWNMWNDIMQIKLDIQKKNPFNSWLWYWYDKGGFNQELGYHSKVWNFRYLYVSYRASFL